MKGLKCACCQRKLGIDGEVDFGCDAIGGSYNCIDCPVGEEHPIIKPDNFRCKYNKKMKGLKINALEEIRRQQKEDLMNQMIRALQREEELVEELRGVRDKIERLEEKKIDDNAPLNFKLGVIT